MTLLNFYLLLGSISKYNHTGLWSFIIWIWGQPVQFIPEVIVFLCQRVKWKLKKTKTKNFLCYLIYKQENLGHLRLKISLDLWDGKHLKLLNSYFFHFEVTVHEKVFQVKESNLRTWKLECFVWWRNYIIVKIDFHCYLGMECIWKLGWGIRQLLFWVVSVSAYYNQANSHFFKAIFFYFVNQLWIQQGNGILLKILENRKKRLFIWNKASRSHGVLNLLFYLFIFLPPSLSFFNPLFSSSSFPFFPLIPALELGNHRISQVW